MIFIFFISGEWRYNNNLYVVEDNGSLSRNNVKIYNNPMYLGTNDYSSTDFNEIHTPLNDLDLKNSIKNIEGLYATIQKTNK